MGAEKIKAFVADLIRLLVPMFVDEDVACDLVHQPDGSFAYETVIALDCVEPGERHDGIVRVRSFSWFGIGWFGWTIGEVRPWR